MHSKSKAIIGFLVILSIAGLTFADRGAKTYGDSCNLISYTAQIFSDQNLANACDIDKGLICAVNKCDCAPGRVWRQNFFEQTFGAGGSCSGGNDLKAVFGIGAIAAVSVIIAPRFFH